mgnify:CR=1 FL=1
MPPPCSFDGEVEYKVRNYGDDTPPAKAKPSSKGPVCEEGERLMPDGFGGKKCEAKVKPVISRVLSSDGSPSPPPPPPSAKAGPAKSSGQSTKSSAQSAPALTFEDLLANSIKQKEAVVGTLSDGEKKELETKLRALMQ